MSARHSLATQGKGISMPVFTSQELPAISADPERLSQVLDNLVGNAFRFTPEGGEIGLSADLYAEFVRIQVRDNGRGIPPDELPYIFDRFYRGDKARQLADGSR